MRSSRSSRRSAPRRSKLRSPPRSKPKMSAELPDNADDISLLAAIADKDQQAFQRFYRRYSSVVYTVARRITGVDQDAEDVVMDVFWELWEKSSRYCPS